MNIFIRDLDDGTHRAAKVAAVIRGETMNEFFVEAIKAAVKSDRVAAEFLNLAGKRSKRKKKFP